MGNSLAEELELLFRHRRRTRFATKPPHHASEASMWSLELLNCDVADIALAYELRSGNDDRRKAQGAFYTPVSVARDLIEFAGVGELPRRILDPACGCGAFLVAAGEWLVDRGLSWPDAVSRLHGSDIDDAAVAICRGRLAELAAIGPADGEPFRALTKRVVVADALAGGEPQNPYDLIVGNPPFGNAIESRTARTDEQRAAYATRFPNAATGAYDKAGLFVELALGQLAPRGKVAFILPRALLSAPYALQLREHIDESFRLDGLRTFESAEHFASAAVFVSGVILTPPTAEAGVRVRRSEADEWLSNPGPGSWAPLLSPFAGVLARIADEWPSIGDFFDVQASAAAGEAYEIREFVSETRPEGGWRLLTTGSIDPFRFLWSEIPTRYLKNKYETPWVPRVAVSERRATLYDRPKVIVAGLSKVLEAVHDTDGSYAGAVATIALTPKVGTDEEALSRICVFLNSWLCRAQFVALHGAQALGGGSVQVTKGKLAALRFPPGLLEARFPLALQANKRALESSAHDAATVRPWEGEIFRLAWGAEWMDGEWIDSGDPAR